MERETHLPQAVRPVGRFPDSVRQDSSRIARFESEIDVQFLLRLRRHFQTDGQFRFLERQRDGDDGHVLAHANLRPEDAVVQRLRRVDPQFLQDGHVVEVNLRQAADKVVAGTQTQSQRLPIAADENVRIESEVITRSADEHPVTAPVEEEIQYVAVVNESEIVPDTRRQIFSQMDSVRAVAEIHFDVQRIVGQQSHGHVVGVRECSAGVEENRVAHQCLIGHRC